VNNKNRREKQTLLAMINIYCRDKHEAGQKICFQCNELLQYACKRIDECQLGDKKTTCARCAIHCFKPEYREKVRAVMRYSGPRMLYNHPVLTFYHLIDSRFKTPKT